MRLAEQRLWDTFRRNRPAGWWMYRVENRFTDGDPDVNVFTLDSVNFVEMKAPHRPVRAATRLLGDEGLSVEQIGWHLKAATMNIKSWVLIRDDKKELFFVRGKYAATINDMSLSELREASVANAWVSIFEEMA